MTYTRLVIAMTMCAAGALAVCAAETKSPPLSGPGAPPAGGAAESEAEPSPWGWLTMPKITMPKIEMPKMPADPLAPVKASAKKVSDGANKAWEGTKELFTFGPSKSAASPPPKTPEVKSPSMWQRMFGGEKKEEPEGPRTVAEFMAQPRLDP